MNRWWWLAVLLALVGVVATGWSYGAADGAAVALILVTAPAQTAFVLVYGLTSPWWQSLVGRALFTKALGLALLIDLSLAYQLLGDDYWLRDAVRLSIYSLIAVGAYLQLAALVQEKFASRRRPHD